MKNRDEDLNDLIGMKADMEEMIELFKEIKGALTLFVRFGNALKWTLTLAATVSGFYYLINKVTKAGI